MHELTIEYWMTKDVVIADRDETVFSAAQKMEQKKVGAVVVVDSEKKPIGIFTERDLLKKVVALGFRAEDMKIKDVMAKNVITINASDNYITANRLIRDRDIRHLPVVDDDGVVVGMLSVRDLRKLIE